MPGFEPQQSEDTGIRDSLAMRQLGTTVSPKDIDKALKPYKMEDAKVKGKSDEQLYNMAQGAVVKWWRRQQRSKIKSKDLTPEREKKQLEQTQQKTERALGKIPAINESPAILERRAEQRQSAREIKRDLLIENRLRGVDPPDYAMVSPKALRAWVRRQVYRRNRLRQRRQRYL